MRWFRALVVVVVVGGATVTAGGAAAAPVLEGTDTVRLRTPTDDVGAHPILRWKAVPDAARYLVVVQTPNGAPYWTWQGVESRVRFGGGPLDAREQSAGARLEKKKVWFVVAYGTDGAVIASSAKRPISP